MVVSPVRDEIVVYSSKVDTTTASRPLQCFGASFLAPNKKRSASSPACTLRACAPSARVSLRSCFDSSVACETALANTSPRTFKSRTKGGSWLTPYQIVMSTITVPASPSGWCNCCSGNTYVARKKERLDDFTATANGPREEIQAFFYRSVAISAEFGPAWFPGVCVFTRPQLGKHTLKYT